jgi:LysM repeat protein
MRKSEYPFDDEGTYRRDWVRDESRDRAGNSYASTAIASTGSGSRTSAARSSSGGATSSTRSEVSSRRKPKPGSAPAQSPPSPETNSAGSTEYASYFGPGVSGTSSPSSVDRSSSMSGPPTSAPSAAPSSPPTTLVSYTPSPAAASPPAPAPSTTYHKVASGDTLYSLSRRYGSSVAEIKRVNGLSSDTIRLGQSLRLP